MSASFTRKIPVNAFDQRSSQPAGGDAEKYCAFALCRVQLAFLRGVRQRHAFTHADDRVELPLSGQPMVNFEVYSQRVRMRVAHPVVTEFHESNIPRLVVPFTENEPA